MEWFINSNYFWLVAILCSLFWGAYGCNHSWNYDKNDKPIEKDKAKRKCLCGCFKDDGIEATGIFLSECIGSMAGWVSLSVLYSRKELGAFDVALLIVAVVGISGFSYRIVEAFKKD